MKHFKLLLIPILLLLSQLGFAATDIHCSIERNNDDGTTAQVIAKDKTIPDGSTEKPFIFMVGKNATASFGCDNPRGTVLRCYSYYKKEGSKDLTYFAASGEGMLSLHMDDVSIYCQSLSLLQVFYSNIHDKLDRAYQPLRE